jgi:hypothetical protein
MNQVAAVIKVRRYFFHCMDVRNPDRAKSMHRKDPLTL